MKSMIVFVSLFSFFKVFFSDNVRIESNMPTELVSGQRHLIEIEIEKGSLQGFSKLELSLPAGFKAMPADIHGASFTFSGGRARFVWMDMPSVESFTVSYFLESEPAKEGFFEISGIFSFVDENIRRDVKIPARQIKLLPQRLVSFSEQSLKDEVELVCERSVVRLNESEFEVKLQVRNNNIQGFGKILETLPVGCIPRKLNDGGAVVTLDGNSVKFVWFEVPDAKGFEVSYLVSCPSACNTLAISGQISYTENRKPYTIDVVEILSPSLIENPQSIEIPDASASQSQQKDTAELSSRASLADNPKTFQAVDSNSQKQVSGDVTVTAEPANAESEIQTAEKVEPAVSLSEKVNEPTAVKDNTPEKVEANLVSKPSIGVSYTVQILAAHKLVEKSYFTARHGYNGGYNIENHEGWIKYTTGKYDDYKQARDAREDVRSKSRNLPGPFVAAYRDGSRITVQEALLVSNQTWYP